MENLIIDEHHEGKNEILQDYLAIESHLLNFLKLVWIKMVSFNFGLTAASIKSSVYWFLLDTIFDEHKLHDLVIESVRILNIFHENILVSVLHRENFDVALIFLVRVIVLNQDKLRLDELSLLLLILFFTINHGINNVRIENNRFHIEYSNSRIA